MGVFDDKVFDDMDFVSKLCEPVFNPLDEKLAMLPNEFIIDSSNILNFIDGGWSGPNSISRDEVVNYLMKQNNLEKLDYDDRKKLENSFDLELTIDDEAIMNLETMEIKGINIRLFKIRERFEEKEALATLGTHALDEFRNMMWNWKSIPVERVNEILDHIGLPEARRKRSVRQKLHALQYDLRKIMRENTWNIRDVELSNKVIKWIILYLNHANGAALVNFCKFKMLTHKSDNPIYSIDEEEV